MSLNSWRSKPYRLLFPLGWLLAWAGVLHWLLHSVGLLADYRPVFHAITQIQGFMLCFALGFLLTALNVGDRKSPDWAVLDSHRPLSVRRRGTDLARARP